MRPRVCNAATSKPSAPPERLPPEPAPGGENAPAGGCGRDLPGDYRLLSQEAPLLRHFNGDPIPREKILAILDIARYAVLGGNSQPVKWLVVHDPERVKKIAPLTVESMKSLQNTGHPMADYVPVLLSAWGRGEDVICRNAPHLLFAIIPDGNPIAPVDAIIALTHVDIAAPAYGVGTFWAGFVAEAAAFYPPLQKELGLPAGFIVIRISFYNAYCLI